MSGAKPRKITTIIGLNGDGFSILVPHHKAQTGYLFKHPVIPDVPKPRFVAWEGGVVFTARDRVKLSYHTDGFAEFSGDIPGRITSSRDLVSGEAKGLGLFSAPLSRPSFVGPSMKVAAYGIKDFEIAREKDELIVFEPGDFYYRNCTPKNANSWTLAIYAFPKNVIPPIRFKQERPTLEVAIEPVNAPIASILELATISLPEEKLFLGLCVNCWRGQHQSESGWVLQGPGDYTQDRRGHVLMGIFPRTEIPLGEGGLLDQKAKSSPADSVRMSPLKPAPHSSPPSRGNRNKRSN